jgi:hypothetical protein
MMEGASTSPTTLFLNQGGFLSCRTPTAQVLAATVDYGWNLVAALVWGP